VGARGLFELLDFLEEWLRDLAVATCQPREGRGGQWDAEVFEEVLARWSIHPSSVTRAIQATDAAREMAAGNVNPQLLIFGLLRDLREELVGQPHGTGSRRHHGQTK
jgi:hypothetical protein